MAKARIRWACPECDEETHFKGLCRECTEYDADGIPIKPVHRVRLNHNPTNSTHRRLTKSDYVNARRKNPSKKQLKALQESLNAHSRPLHLQHELDEASNCCASETCETGCDDEIIEMGESIGGEEE